MTAYKDTRTAAEKERDEQTLLDRAAYAQTQRKTQEKRKEQAASYARLYMYKESCRVKTQ